MLPLHQSTVLLVGFEPTLSGLKDRRANRYPTGACELMTGIEPASSCLQGKRTNQRVLHQHHLFSFGAGGGSRTRFIRVTKAVLVHTSFSSIVPPVGIEPTSQS